MHPRRGGGGADEGAAASTSGRTASSSHNRTASGGSSNAAASSTAAAATTMPNPLSRGHSLLADYLDAAGEVPLPQSEVHMNAPVPTREHVGKKERERLAGSERERGNWKGEHLQWRQRRERRKKKRNRFSFSRGSASSLSRRLLRFSPSKRQKGKSFYTRLEKQRFKT